MATARLSAARGLRCDWLATPRSFSEPDYERRPSWSVRAAEAPHANAVVPITRCTRPYPSPSTSSTDRYAITRGVFSPSGPRGFVVGRSCAVWSGLGPSVSWLCPRAEVFHIKRRASDRTDALRNIRRTRLARSWRAESRTDPFKVGDAQAGGKNRLVRHYGLARRSSVLRVGIRARGARCGTSNRCKAEQRGAANGDGGDRSLHHLPPRVGVWARCLVTRPAMVCGGNDRRQVLQTCCGETEAPCGTPSSNAVHDPSSMTPAANHLLISRRTRLSAIRCSTNRSSH